MIINYYLNMPKSQRQMIVHILRYDAEQLLHKTIYDKNMNVKIIKRSAIPENSWYYHRRDYLTYLARKITVSHYKYAPNYNELINLWVCTEVTLPYLRKYHHDGKPILRALTREWVIMLLVKAGNKYLKNPEVLSTLKTDYENYVHDKYNFKQEHQLMVKTTKLIEQPKAQGVKQP